MTDFTCQQAECAASLTWSGRGPHPKYCETHKRERKLAGRRQYAATHVSSKTCTEPGCDSPVRAHRLCAKHYERTRQRTPDKPTITPCTNCGKILTRWGGGYKAKLGHFCDETCKSRFMYGWSEELPADHWARMYGATCDWVAPKEEPPAFQCGTCYDCGALIVEPAWQTPSRYCSRRCSRRVGRRKRRAREFNAPGEYRYSEIMRLYQQQGRVCAYCQQPVIGLPDPEHVLPLSRGGRNDTSNLVAACRACNTDKGDLTLTEWTIDRARRDLPVLRTVFDANDPTYWHLVMREPTCPAWRDLEAA